MTLVEILTVLSSVISLTIAAASLIRTRQIATEQIRLDGVMADLARKQLEQIATQEYQNKLPLFTVTLTKLGKDQNFLIANRGNGSANNIEMELINCTHSPLYDVDDKFPWPELRPGQRIKIGAAIHLGSPSTYQVRLKYIDAFGETRTEDHHVAL